MNITDTNIVILLNFTLIKLSRFLFKFLKKLIIYIIYIYINYGIYQK